MHPRRKAREWVLQGLYSMAISKEDKDKVLADILARGNPQKKFDLL